MFGFMKGAQGSPMSRMSDQQKLQALGSAFSGDQKGLQSILAQFTGDQPVMNEEGDDISAAFGSGGGMGGNAGILGQLMGDAPLGLPMKAIGRRFGFGGR